MSTMTTTKAELRQRLRALERAMTAEEKAASDAALREGFLEIPEYRAARTVLLYVGTGAEVDTRPLIEDALAAGKRVALPVITGPGVMEARAVTDLDLLVPGPCGIPAPGEGSELVPPEAPDLILVPGMAFTQDGWRLGRGGGYYDRYLPRTNALTVALARDFQMVDHIPTEAHDIPVDALVIDSGDEE